MKYSIGLPTERPDAPEEFYTGAAVAEMAREAEAAGFDACFVTDHPAPDSKWLAAGGHHAHDPFVALSFAAAATTRLMMQTHILVLVYRNPFLAARSIQGLQTMSEGRLILGVAAGYLKPEFRALGVDFDARNEALDEAIDTVRATLRDETVAAEGQAWSARGVQLRPQPTPPPIWVGGNSYQAARRAVDRGDGWVPFPNPASAGRAARTPPLSNLDEFADRLGRLREYAVEVGRTEPLDVCFGPFSLNDRRRYDGAAVRAEIEELEALGVTWVTVGAVGTTRSEWLDSMRRLAEELRLESADR